MSSHNVHPSIREHGLADDCPRCSEHAECPFEGLDKENLTIMVANVFLNRTSRSTNESIAMLKVAQAMNVAEKLYRHGWRPS